MMRPIIAFVLIYLLFVNVICSDYFAYAPSRNGKSLICVKVSEINGKIKLELERTIELGIAAVSITANTKNNSLYIAEAKGGDQVKGAYVMCDQKGAYVKHETIHLDHGYCYVSLDKNANYLMGVSYGGGQVDVYQLNDRGIPVKTVSSLDEGRKAAHCILVSPDNKNIYIPYVKDNNALFQYSFNESNGQLMPLTPKNALPPEGTGPRHMAYHPNKNMVYFSNEQGVGVSVYQRFNDGQLKFLNRVDVVDEERSKEGLSASDIVITPDAKFLYTGLRGQKQNYDHISRYKILASGEVEFLGLTKTDPIPWGMCTSPDGKTLLVTSANGNKLLAYRIKDSGDLELQDSLPWDSKITDVVTLNDLSKM